MQRAEVHYREARHVSPGYHIGHTPAALLGMRLIVILAGLLVPAYLVWRVGFTLSGSTLWLAIPLLLAEIHGFLTFVGFAVMSWESSPPYTPRPQKGAGVDFFIPTYNEPFSVLAPTIAGALAVRYPHKTYVLDDGRRAWVKRLCKSLGAGYLTRPDNAHAKAGNLNSALRKTSGEFVAIVDADFVPSPSFLDDTLGFFRDPDVAFVQGPQEFYNRESFQHLAGDEDGWHEQRVFFSTIQTGKNRWNAAFWCGSPSILRREALEDVGGVAEDTVTEDLHTSLKLHGRGWKSVYQPKTIALGLAPNNYEGFILQRLRWAQGTMQVIRKEWRARGLTLAQLVNYVASTSTYFDALRKATFLVVLPLVILADALPVSAPASLFLPFWLMQFFVTAYAMKLLGRGTNRYLMTEFFDLMKMFAFLQASLTLLSGRRVSFRVTPKGSSSGHLRLRRVVPFALLALVYCVSIGIGAARLSGFGLSTAHPFVQLVAVLWSAGILAFLCVIVTYGFRKDSRRQADRVDVGLPGSYRSRHVRREVPVVLQNLTTTGCAFQTELPPIPGETLTISVSNEDCSFSARVRSVRRISAPPVPQSPGPAAQSFLVGVSITTNERVRAQLARLIAAGLFTNAAPSAPIDENRRLEAAAA